MQKQAWSKNADFLKEIFLAGEDAARIHGSLSKLARHVMGPIVVTGGIAVGWHLLRHGVLGEKRRFNDIDLVVESLSRLRPTLSQDFLIRHFHPLREKGKILIMLVDEEYRTRIDIFTPNTASLARRLKDSADSDMPLGFVSAEDLLAKLLSITHAASRGRPVEPKYMEHFRLLYALADAKRMKEVWPDYRKENQPLDFEPATEDVLRSVKANPALLQSSDYCQDIKQTCSWCQESERFPLAPLRRVHRVLGYV